VGHRDIEHGVAAQRSDEGVVEEDVADIVRGIADIRPPLAEEPARPGRLVERLAPTHRIRGGLIGIAALGLARVGVIAEHGEEPVADNGGQRPIQRGPQRRGLARLGERRRHCLEMREHVGARRAGHYRASGAA
jgi:hypothetical protein